MNTVCLSSIKGSIVVSQRGAANAAVLGTVWETTRALSCVKKANGSQIICCVNIGCMYSHSAVPEQEVLLRSVKPKISKEQANTKIHNWGEILLFSHRSPGFVTSGMDNCKIKCIYVVIRVEIC